MADNFINSVQVGVPGTNFFDMSCDRKMSLKMGALYPAKVFECLPNDRWRLSQDILTKFAPLVSPVMHRINVFAHNWFVPFRLLWKNFEDWISQQGTFVAPFVYLDETNTGIGTLADYLGFPVVTGTGPSNRRMVSAFPFAAYQFIYHEWYRDQNLIPEFNYELVDGDNTSNADLFVLRKRAWMHDMFTSAAPSTQVGDPVEITPVQQFRDAIVKYNDLDVVSIPNPAFIPVNSSNVATTGDGTTVSTRGGDANTDDAVFNAAEGGLYADMSSLELEAITVNDLRLAEMLQKYRERLMRVGRRYKEWLRGVWGVIPQDARLQQPEYIGGSIAPVIISDIMSTAQSADAARPLADRGGTAMSVNSGIPDDYHVKEQGYMLVIVSVMPVTAYQQGIPKAFLKFDPLDYYTPDLAQIGEQPVTVQEIYAAAPIPGATLGYLPAYYDYRLSYSDVAGEFKTSLSHWTMARIFDSPPALNQQFIECDPTTRIFAVEEGADTVYMQVVHNAGAYRPVTKFGIPSL